VHPTVYAGKTALLLPLRGRIYVFDGHVFYSHHRRQDVFRSGRFQPNSVRYAYDFMAMDANGNLYRGDRFKKENWLSYFSGFKRLLGTKFESVRQGQVDSGDILEYIPSALQGHPR